MYPYLMDTDHVSLIGRGGEVSERIIARIVSLPSVSVAVSVVSYEEQMRGWMAEIARTASVERQMAAYARLDKMRDYYCSTPVVPFDTGALEQFQCLWLLRLRVGTMDLKIAATALASNAVLVTRNVTDFAKVPGLNIEDWSV
jgi:tRNA(fMet)-specific endonuclease VapC